MVGSISALSPADDGSWWTVWPTVVVAVVLALLPGWLLARAWGIRGVAAPAAAPALLLGVVGPATVIGGALGIRWDVTPWGPATRSCSPGRLCSPVS